MGLTTLDDDDGDLGVGKKHTRSSRIPASCKSTFEDRRWLANETQDGKDEPGLLFLASSRRHRRRRRIVSRRPAARSGPAIRRGVNRLDLDDRLLSQFDGSPVID